MVIRYAYGLLIDDDEIIFIKNLPLLLAFLMSLAIRWLILQV